MGGNRIHFPAGVFMCCSTLVSRFGRPVRIYDITMMVMRVVKLPHELANEDANMCERERMFKDYL